MKRKDADDVDDDFSLLSPSTKSRRLDGGDWPSIMEEDVVASIGVPPPPQHQQASIGNAQSNASLIDTMASPQETAIVLYNPPKTSFFKSPTLPDFSIVINSDSFPGLKERLLFPQNPWAVNSIEGKIMNHGSTSGGNDCLAVVPWVAPQHLVASGAETGITVTAPLQPMESEDLMDTEEENSVGNIAGKTLQDGEMVDGAEAFQLWQQQHQHHLMSQFPQNMYPQVTW